MLYSDEGGATRVFTLTDVRYRHILDIPSLTIPSDAVTAIVGKSGSGKTTLLKMLNRLVTPDAGRIDWKGASLTETDPVQLRRRVVMLAQAPVMFDGTLRENVLKGRAFSGDSELDDDSLRRLLEVVHLDKPLDAGTDRLSGGEKQRVAFARVLAMEPEVLLLDEPTSALDEGTEQLVMRDVIAFTQERGISVVFVTHARSIAREYGEHLIEIEAGRVVSDGARPGRVSSSVSV